MYKHATMGTGVAVLGASGYTGVELLRLLAHHPVLSVVAASAERSAGARAAAVHPSLAPTTPRLELVPAAEAAAAEADVCISCLPGTELAGLVESVTAEVVVDLSDVFRADGAWVYGLTEYARADLPGARRIANPGCYPTATLLCVLPFAQSALIEGPIIVDALSGASGAGRKSETRLLLSELHASTGAYGTTEHRHIPEMERGLARFGDLDAVVSFTPHLVPMARGVLVTARAHLREPLSSDEATAILRERYAREPFVNVVDEWPQTKWALGTNHIFVSARVDERAGFVVMSSAIDNLGKGAAGQAIQNVNVALGLDEVTGLEAGGIWP